MVPAVGQKDFVRTDSQVCSEFPKFATKFGQFDHVVANVEVANLLSKIGKFVAIFGTNFWTLFSSKFQADLGIRCCFFGDKLDQKPVSY